MIDSKICSKCGVDKNIVDFAKQSSGLYKAWCRDCCNEHKREWYKKNKEYSNQKSQEWYINNKQYARDNYRSYHNDYIKKRSSTDPLFKLERVIRSLIKNSTTRYSFTKTSRTAAILGITFEEFKEYLEKRFMETYNRKLDPTVDKCHIDHIIPLSSAKVQEDVIKLNHYTNLQLLLAEDNLRKGDKLDFEVKSST